MEIEKRGNRACASCALWIGNPIDRYPAFGVDDADLGQCRKRAPVVTGGMMSDVITVWPMTRVSDWCAEFEPKQ